MSAPAAAPAAAAAASVRSPPPLLSRARSALYAAVHPRSAGYPWLLAAAALAAAALPHGVRAAAGRAAAAAALAAVGVPHGALDGVVSAATAARTGAAAGGGYHAVRFYAWYMSLAGLYAAAWVAAPAAAAAAFALLTALHFGQTDLEALAVTHADADADAGAGAGAGAGGGGGADDAAVPAAGAAGLLARAVAVAHTGVYGAAVTLSLVWPEPETDATAASSAALLASVWPPLQWLAAAIRALPPHAALLCAVVLSQPAVVAALQPRLQPRICAASTAQVRWVGFVVLLLLLSHLGAAAGSTLPFAFYFGGWHSMQAFAHVGALIPDETLQAHDWLRWARGLCAAVLSAEPPLAPPAAAS